MVYFIWSIKPNKDLKVFLVFAHKIIHNSQQKSPPRLINVNSKQKKNRYFAKYRFSTQTGINRKLLYSITISKRSHLPLR